jgi:Zn-finger nucleic acid-binding protein
MQCPVCKTEKCSPVELEENLKAASCETCGGYWISNQNYSTWLKRHGETIPEKPFSEVEFDVSDVHDAKLCPDCNRILLKYKVGHGLDFFVDHCPGCGGIWLDTNEWNALQDKNLHDEIHKMFSTSWQTQIRGDQMASKLDQVYTNRLGPESYEKAKEIRQWIQDNPQKQAILAFLSDENPYKI